MATYYELSIKKGVFMGDINFMKVRTGSLDIVQVNNTVNQTLTLTNKSIYDITNIYVIDTFSEGITFKAKSVVINGTSYPDANPQNGFNLPDNIKATNSATITYTITISESFPKYTIQSAVTYTADGSEYTENSNVYNMELANGDLTLQKSAPIVSAKGKIYTYETIVTNVGNIRNTNITFKDSIPAGTTFVNGSVKIDNVAKADYNPETGFALANLDPKAKTSVKFDVQVN